MLKSYGWWVVVVAYSILVGLKGLGPGLDNCQARSLRELRNVWTDFVTCEL